MNPLQRLFLTLSGAKASVPAPGRLFAASSFDGDIPTYPKTFPGWDKWIGSSPQAEAMKAMASAWVYSDIQAIGREFSSANLLVNTGEADDQTEIKGHELSQLWNRPNPHMGKSFLMQFWISQILLSGEAYLFFAPYAGTTQIAEVWPIPSWMISPVIDDVDFIGGYKLKTKQNGKAVTINIPSANICFSRLPNPSDVRRGLSPLMAAMMGIETDIAAASWNRNFFGRDNGIPAALVSVAKDVQNTEFQTIKAAVTSGLFSNRRIEVIRAGDISIEQFQNMHKDLDFLSGRQFSRDEIDRIFGIPGGYWTANATEANARHAKAVLAENVVWPLLKALSEDLTSQIIPIFYGEGQEAAFTDIRPRNIALELQETEAKKVWLTIDELRIRDGLKELGDWRGELLPAQISPTTPLDEPEPPGPMPAALAGAQPAQLNGAQDMTGDANTEDTEQDPAASEAEIEGEDAAAKAIPAGYFADLDRWQRKAAKALKAGKPAAVRFESDHIDGDNAQAIADLLASAKTADEISAAFTIAPFLKVAGGGDLKPDEIELNKATAAALAKAGAEITRKTKAGQKVNWTAIAFMLRAAIVPVLIQTVLASVEHWTGTLGLALPHDEIVAGATEWVDGACGDVIDGLVETTRKAVEKVKSKKLSAAEIALLLIPLFGSARAMLIAITENSRALDAAAWLVWNIARKLGISLDLFWQTAEDEHVCPECESMDGKPREQWGNQRMPAHPRCRCRPILVLRTT